TSRFLREAGVKIRFRRPRSLFTIVLHALLGRPLPAWQYPGPFGGSMLSTDSEKASLPEPKQLYRLLEPSYDDIDSRDPADFISAAVERTVERFAEDCGIDAAVAARREGHAWVPVGEGPGTLLQAVDALDDREREVLQANRVAFGMRPFLS